MLRSNVRSPQFQQALDSLDDAISSEQSAAILQSLQLYEKAVFDGSSDPIDAVMKYLAKHYAKK